VDKKAAGGPGNFALPHSEPVPRIFLLSPANVSGIRAKLILREDASFPLALRLRDGRLTLGQAFSFISGLYFRGKLAYARAFAQPPPNTAGALVITACGGLLCPEMLLTRETLCAISSFPWSAMRACLPSKWEAAVRSFSWAASLRQNMLNPYSKSSETGCSSLPNLWDEET